MYGSFENEQGFRLLENVRLPYLYEATFATEYHTSLIARFRALCSHYCEQGSFCFQAHGVRMNEAASAIFWPKNEGHALMSATS